MEDNKFLNTFKTVSGFLAAIVVVCALGLVSIYPLVKTVFATGTIDYCYTTSETYTNPAAPNVVVYQLHGHRSWREDRTISRNLKSMDEVKAAAATYGCELH